MKDVDGEILIDTNVVVKLFFEEPENDRAAGLFDKFERGRLQIIIPDFLPIEFANVLWVKSRRGDLGREECLRVSNLFRALLSALRIVPCMALLDEILTASIQHDHPAYDVAFLVLAKSLDIPFITADVKFYRKVSSQYNGVVLLRDIAL